MLAVVIVHGFLAPDQALAETEDDDEDDEAPFVFDADWTPVLEIAPDGTVENLFLGMGRVAGPEAPCGTDGQQPLLAQPEPEPGSWACVQLVNKSDRPGLWRVDFEGTFGAGYRLELLQDGQRGTILYNPGPGVLSAEPLLTVGRWLASRPILIPAGGSVDLYVRAMTPSDLADADPILLPEETFDSKLLKRGHSFALLLGSSALLLAFFIAFAQLLHSPPARRFAIYFGAATLAAASNEGYLNFLAPANPVIVMGSLDKLLEAAQITAHFLFMAAFIRDGVPDSRLEAPVRRLGWIAGVGLIVAAIGSFAIGGTEGAIRYHDLGFEIDPLIDDPFASPSALLGALIIASWYTCALVVAYHVVRRGANGGRLFAAGAAILVFGMIFAGFGEELTGLVGDDHMLPQFVLLADALMFAAAMVWQVFGIRNQRDAAVRQELEATRKQMRLAEDLLQSRKDLDRTRALAETHRERLALTGHDLRQPLTSLQLALSELDTSNPELGQTLRTNVEYLRSVLNETVAETRPEDLAEDEGAYHTRTSDAETVPVEVFLSNAVRMFGEEARRKGLDLTSEETDVAVRTVPVTLIRILSNLVSNAVKYTDAGGVTLRAVTEDGSVTLEVLDTGPGLTAEEIADIRQSYHRGESARTVAGDGLGLSSAESLAASIGLRLAVRSTPGEGSVFAIAGLEMA